MECWNRGVRRKNGQSGKTGDVARGRGRNMYTIVAVGYVGYMCAATETAFGCAVVGLDIVGAWKYIISQQYLQHICV